jgi:hypothetical protein
MPHWLARLFRRHAESATSPAPEATLEALAPSVAAEPATAADDGDARERQAVAVAVEAREARERETCPTCGGTGVFAGPPGHRYCMRCALRSERI